MREAVHSVQLLGSPLVHEDPHCKYLGIIMEEDMSLSKDVERVSKALMKQFHSFYAKFSYISGEMLYATLFVQNVHVFFLWGGILVRLLKFKAFQQPSCSVSHVCEESSRHDEMR